MSYLNFKNDEEPKRTLLDMHIKGKGNDTPVRVGTELFLLRRTL